MHRGAEPGIILLSQRLKLAQRSSPMPTQCSRDLFGYEVVEGRQVVAAFDGGDNTSDAGGLLLGATDRAIDLVARFAACFVDRRAQAQVEHTVAAMVAQRIFGIALGYEDLIDHDQLRHDPVLATLAGKLTARRKDCAPLAGKSTLNRLEHAPSETSRYHKIGHNGGRQAKVSTYRLGPGETLGLVDGGPEGHRHHRPHTWDGHQARAHFVLADGPEELAVQRGVFAAERRSGPQQRLGDPLETGLAGDELADAGLELAFADHADLQPEAAQDAAEAALDVPQLGYQQLARGQQGSNLLHHGRLDVDRSEPTHAHQLRHPTRIVAVGLHSHRLERRLDVAGLGQDRRPPRPD